MTIEDMIEQHGYYVDEVGGEVRYVTRDSQGFARIGPLRHGLKARRPKVRPAVPPQNDAEATILLPSGAEVGIGVAPVYDAKEGWRARWLRRLRDKQWHNAVQHLAVDIAMWASCLSLAAVALKVAYWVVML